MSAFLYVLSGAVVSVIFGLWVERSRRPVLDLAVTPPQDMVYADGHPAKEARFLSIGVTNRPLREFGGWFWRHTATQCKATISFYHLDKQDVFGRTMIGRWAASPQPIPITGMVGDKPIALFDPVRMSLSSTVDIEPGRTAALNIVARFDAEAECYGWNNESYLPSDPKDMWRNQRWRLPPGRYLVKATVRSSGQTRDIVVRLINDVDRSAFRLEPGQASDLGL